MRIMTELSNNKNNEQHVIHITVISGKYDLFEHMLNQYKKVKNLKKIEVNEKIKLNKDLHKKVCPKCDNEKISKKVCTECGYYGPMTLIQLL